MKTTIDFALGIILSLLAYLSCLFYLFDSPFTSMLSLGSLTLFLVGYLIYLKHTSYFHLTCLLIIPFIIWVILLKHTYIASLDSNLRVLAYVGVSFTGLCIARGLYQSIKFTTHSNFQA